MQNSPKEILIIGGGEVGVKTAKRLHSQRNITMIERDPEIIKRMSDQGDIQLIQGSGTCPHTLEEARAHEMDMVIAVTDSDEVNIMSCWLVRQLVDAQDAQSPDEPPRELSLYARVRNPSLERYVRNNKALGISHVINPERLCVDKIVERLTYNNLIETLTFERGLINLYGVKIVEGAPAVNKDLLTLTEGKDLTIAAMSKDMSPETIIPSKDDVIEANDDIYFCASRDSFPRIYRQLCGSPSDKTTVYIAGASKIGLEIARRLAANGEEELEPRDEEGATEKTDMRFKVFVFDSDEEKIEQIEQSDPDGDINYFCDTLSDLGELQSHSIKPQDVIITCSEDAEENIVGSLLARKLGFKRIMIIANNERHHEVIREQGLEVVKNPRQIAVIELSQKINSDLTVAFQTLSGAEDTEVREFIVTADNPFIGKTLAELSASDDWPEQGALVASIMRGTCAILLSGQTDIRDGDRLFVISHVKHFNKIEGLFEPKRSGLRLWPRSLL